MTNSEDNPLRIQLPMMRFLMKGGIMKRDFNMTYTYRTESSNFNITYFSYYLF